MKTTLKKISLAFIVLGFATTSLTVAFAQVYDTGTTYPTYDTGTTYPTYDTGTTYPTYDTGTTYPTYDTGTTYPTYDTGTTYPTYDTGTTYPTYTTGTTYPTYDTGTTYPTYTTGTTYPTYDTGTTYPTYPTYDTGTTYQYPTYSTGNTYSYPNYTTGSTYSYPNYTTGSTYSYPTYTSPSYSYPSYNQNQNTVTVVPGTNTYICSNGSTPVNGVCGSVTTIPTVNTQVCSNGQAPVNGNCTITTTIPTTTNTICSNGQAPVNGSCTITTTIPFVNNTICSNGQAPVNGSCTITNTIPTTVTTLCSNGSAPVNGTCAITNTIPTTVNTICSDGLARNYDGSCTRTNTIIATQVCYDGTRISTTQTCPSQYKICPNGSYVLNNQSCYGARVVPQEVVKFNNVVTSVATQITNTSGRCNGIGLIANGAASTGWFEYGETSNLGRTTATASIGNNATAPFSNVLASLKPSTKYYCRAVMQNQYGIVKGEIVSFVTKSKAVQYVKPVTKPVTVVKKPVTKPATTVTCVDGSYVTVKSATSAALLSQGNKLVSLQIEKTEGKLMANGAVTYKVIYKNLAETRLSDVVVKIVLPEEVKSVMATTGNFDEGTHTLTVNQNSMDAFSEGILTISGTLAENSPVGKTIVATTYVVYTVPGTHSQDEVTAYVVGSILPVDSTTKLDTGAKKVIGNSDRGFMPSSLVEWLALIAIMAIIFILARSIYISYQDDGDAHGH